MFPYKLTQTPHKILKSPSYVLNTCRKPLIYLISIYIIYNTIYFSTSFGFQRLSRVWKKPNYNLWKNKCKNIFIWIIYRYFCTRHTKLIYKTLAQNQYHTYVYIYRERESRKRMCPPTLLLPMCHCCLFYVNIYM